MTPDPARLAALCAGLGGEGAVHLALAPGRVNLIGEHTDYNGLPVLPMAIGADVWVAGRRAGDRTVTLENVAPRFPPCRFPLSTAVPPAPPGDWSNYVRAAVQAVAAEVVDLGGLVLRVDGRVPVAAGVSSSAALVVASACAALAVAGVAVPPLVLAERLARAEQYVGTLSGGMDQAAILLGAAGCALRLDFHPLRARAVPLPSDLAVIVADTCEPAAKAGAVRGHYNQRVVECRLATAVLARRLGMPLPHLGALADRPAVLRELDVLLPATARRAALPALCGRTAASLAALLPPAVVLADPETFVLRARARHALAEADRVDAAEAALRAGDLPALGALVDASHASCTGDHAVGTPTLDRLVGVLRDAGALGARLMGAGFGGSALAVVRRADVPAVLDGLDARFYGPGRGALRFAATPAAGARAVRVD
ncbi:MAG: hypothetical protein KIT14_18275 [bacterium]|nr:hypothetical protein [bacterium]